MLECYLRIPDERSKVIVILFIFHETVHMFKWKETARTTGYLESHIDYCTFEKNAHKIH